MRDSELEPEHRAFRETVRDFVSKEILPHHERWERDGMVDRDVWLAAGEAGLLGFNAPQEYGGIGVQDYRFHALLSEEIVRAGATGITFGLHNSVVGPYLTRLTTPEQKMRWLPASAPDSWSPRSR